MIEVESDDDDALEEVNSDGLTTGCCLSLMVLYTCFRMAYSPFTRCLCGV